MSEDIKVTDGTVLESLNNKADRDLLNLTEEGEKHFLNKSQITNCLTEIPQTVKLDLTNDVLTIKAGTIITVPYGTTDLSSTYSVGSQFLNSNFKVVDTHYSNNQFFVRAELQSDITRTFTGTGNYGLYIGFLSSNNSLIITFTQKSYSGTVDPATTYCSWYNTSENKVRGYTTSYDRILSFPLGKITISDGTVTSIDNVFNGIGYIGSTVWVDKGVKGLMPNGRNADGSLNNIEFTTDKVLTFTTSYDYNADNSFKFAYTNGILSLVQGYITYWFEGSLKNIPPKQYAHLLNTDDNDWYYCPNGDVWIIDDVKYLIYTGNCGLDASGAITSFNPKQPFRAVDYNEYKPAIDNKISKAGDTMTGNLRIEKNSGGVQVQGTGYKGIYTYSTDIDYTAVNQTNLQASVMSSYDKNNKCFAFNQHFIDGAGRVRNELRASRVINGTTYQAYLAFCVSATGAPEIFINGQTLRAYLIQTYQNGTSGYNIWSNGYCEQWGRTGTGQGLKTVTLLKTFANTNYSVLTTGTYDGDSTDNGWDYVRNITTTSFDIYQQAGGCMWKACGYLASGQY